MSAELVVLSLRYSSWSMRAWVALRHAGIQFETRTVVLEQQTTQTAEGGVVRSGIDAEELKRRREAGSVTGQFPVLWVDGTPIHESLAICEWAAEQVPTLWPRDPLARAQARAHALEMVTGFANVRQHMSCHVRGRMPGFTPNPATRDELDRLFAMWRTCLSRSGGPCLMGEFGIVDAMYLPVLTRLVTYGVALPDDLHAYADAVADVPAVRDWAELAATAPAIPVYDEYLRGLGGDPEAGAGAGLVLR